MDKRNKRYEATDQKSNNKIKDRGDLKKVNDKPNKKITDENIQVNIKQFPDHGDSERKTTNQKPEKMRMNIIVKKPTNEESRIKNASDSTVEKEQTIKKHSDRDGIDKALDLELRKRIREKYTLKLKSINKIVTSNSNVNKKDEASNLVAKSDGSKNADRPKKQLIEETTQTKEKFDSSLSSGKSDDNKDKKSERNPGRTEVNSAKRERHSVYRKPMIKTITSKNGPVRIYKAVTFVDQRREPTPLEINIPGSTVKKQTLSKCTDTNSLKIKTKSTISRASFKEKPVAVRKKHDRKRDRKSRHMPSPDNSLRNNSSPPTEVARWAPSCMDKHTKPYYEAWVNTTLAAISKSSKKDKLYYEKQRELILKSFQRALEERPTTPELFYENFADERYTGRIKVTHR